MAKDEIQFRQHGVLYFVAKVKKDSLPHLVGTTLDQTLLSSPPPSLPHAFLTALPPLSPQSANNTTAAPMDLILWHRRLSHLNYDALRSMISKNLVKGLNITSRATPDPICEPCLAGNMHRIIPKQSTPKGKILELVVSDVHGPMPTASHQGNRYWTLFEDVASRHWGLHFLKLKSQNFSAFKSYRPAIELATGEKIKAFQDDKGGEYMSKEFEEYLEKDGIKRRHTMRAEPHSNGIAERANRIIADRATSLLHESKLPPSFWDRAVAAVVYTHNRTPTSTFPHTTPHKQMFGEDPDVSLIRVFGSLAYVHVKRDKRKGLSPHMQKAIFVLEVRLSLCTGSGLCCCA
jgi:transposase InsO family protein